MSFKIFLIDRQEYFETKFDFLSLDNKGLAKLNAVPKTGFAPRESSAHYFDIPLHYFFTSR